MVFQVLIVEDQEEISSIVDKYLTNEGYNCHVSKDGFLALEYINNNTCHLIILDIMMPGIDGFTVLSEIRKLSDVPVIMLTARQAEVDRLKGFDQGADDYIVKPFSVRELVKRVRAIMRRTYHEENEIIYTYKELSLFTGSKLLRKEGKLIEITSTEYKLLLTLFKNINQILSREQLITKSFGQLYEGYDRNIDSYIKRIRQKIEDDANKPKYLLTKYGIGYVLGGDKK